MTIDARFNTNPFIGDVLIDADEACTNIVCTEDPNMLGHYIVQQDIIIYGPHVKDIGKTIARITLRRYTKDMSTGDALYFVTNYFNKNLENPPEE